MRRWFTSGASRFLLSCSIITAVGLAIGAGGPYLLAALSQPAQAQNVMVMPGSDQPVDMNSLPILGLPPSTQSEPTGAEQTRPEQPAIPEPAQLIAVPGFAEPLVATGPTTPEEDAALTTATTAFSDPANTGKDFPEAAAPVLAFLAQYPNSSWAMALQTNLGLGYYHSGYFSRAFSAWEAAWKLGRHAQSIEAKRLTDRAVGELARMHARVGHAEVLEQLFADIGDRKVEGAATEMLTGAQEGVSVMRGRPGIAYLCGPKALANVLRTMNAAPEQVKQADSARSGPNGFNLTQLSELATQAGLAHRLVHRKPGQPVPVPSVVNWKINHYAAIIEERNGRYHVQDPTFASGDLWLTQAAIDAESSGYFLVPGTEQKGERWRIFATGAEEANSVYGKGYVTDGSPGDTMTTSPKMFGSCSANQGMCGYNAHSATISLNLTDTPLGVAASKGPAVNFTLTYNQREAGQPANFGFSNISPKWSHSWMAYVEDDPGSPYTLPVTHPAGGGYIYSLSNYGFNTQNYLEPETGTGAVLYRLPTNTTTTSYERRFPDGSKEVYGKSDNSTAYPRRWFLTQVIDPQGNTVNLAYDTQLRLSSITDAAGKVTTLSYELGGYPLLITKVTDPFGRAANFTYDAGLRLASITDPIGIVSSFGYDGSGLVNVLNTPYGTSNFSFGVVVDPGTGKVTSRWLEPTDPLGNTERIEFRGFTSALAAADPCNVTPNYYSCYPGVTFRFDEANTFYWNRVAFPGNSSDFTKAVISHWTLSGLAQGGMTPILSTIKKPLENRVWFNYYPNSIASNKPTQVMRVLDDGATQYRKATYNIAEGSPDPAWIGTASITSATDALGRKTVFNYAANGIDLTSVQQQISATPTYATLATYTYDANHNVLTASDAAGKVWRNAYNAAGQLIYATNPLNQTRFWEYDAAGRMTRATVPVAVAHASVVYGTTNVSAATAQSWNYTVACSGVTAPANTNLPISVTDSQGYALCYQYDNLDRVTKVKYPDNTFDVFDYSFPSGLANVPTWGTGAVPAVGSQSLDVWKVTDRQGRVTSYHYDRNRRMIAATETLVDPVFVAESGNNRVLVYDVATIGNGESAQNVLGQSSFTTGTAAATAAGLNSPRGVAYDSVNNRLFVADTGNNRVLVYDMATITNGQNAVNVLGQSSYTGTAAATTQAGMNAPEELAYDSGNNRLYVADSGNNRVLVYDVAAITNGENAINVLGQSSFTTGTAATTQAGMSGPRGMVYDSVTNRLYVAGAGNNRVTVYDVATITNGENAINVLGQSSFTTSAAATTQAGLSGPRGLAYDRGAKRLFVAGNTNNRVTVYDVATITNGENAINVLGQSSFTASAAATTAAGMSAPAAVGFDSLKNLLFVSGTGNNRVTVYDVATITNGESAINVIGQSSFTTGTAATTQAGLSSPRGMVYERNTRTTRYSYYADGTMKELTDAKGNVTHWDIDIQSRPVSKTYAFGTADAKTETYTYDIAGRLKTVTDALGQVKTITYALDNAPLSYTYSKPVTVPPLPDTANVSFTYDEFFPRLATMTDMSGLNGTTGLPAPATTSFAYGALGTTGALLPLEESNDAYYNQHAAWYYDDAGRLTSRWAAESEETFGYDLLGRLNSYGTPLGTFTLGYLGNSGQMTSRSVTNGGVTLSQTYAYDTNTNDRRLLSITANTSAVRSYSYGYAYGGGVDRFNIRTIAESATAHPLGTQSWVYDYDKGDRLMAASATAVAGSGASSYGTYSWGYDKLDNAKPIVYPSTEFGGYTDNPTYNALNQQTQNAWWQNFTYDSAGNITREYNETNTTLRQYSYDMEGRLLTMTNGTAGYEVRFFYDGMGRRILQKTTNAGVVTYKRYLWCGSTICQQRDAGTNSIRRYLATGEYVNATTTPAAPAKKYVYFQDHLGSVGDLVDATTGARVGALDYKPYGAVKASNGVLPDFQYAGLMWVGEVGLNASATRFLDPGTTRWMTADWIGELGGINMSVYVGGNPVNVIDPMGTCGLLTPACLWAAAAAEVTGSGLTLGNAAISAAGGLSALRAALGIERIVSAARIARNAKLGQLGESRARQMCEIGDKMGFKVGGQSRIADGRIEGQSISEVKAGKYQALTQQIRDYITHSQNTGEKFSLYTTNPNFTPSGPLQKAFDSGLINHVPVP